MHYKNGREAQNGDTVIYMPSYAPPIVGILFNVVPGNDLCNGRVAPLPMPDGGSYPNLAECLHVEDALDMIAENESLHQRVAELEDRLAAVRADLGLDDGDGSLTC